MDDTISPIRKSVDVIALDAGSGMIPCPGVFGRYDVKRVLGSGGMGTVYLAYDRQADTSITLKVPNSGLLDIPEVLAAFLHEAKTLFRLHHPNLCRIYDVNYFEGIQYIAMAYVEGGPLGPTHAPTPRAAADLVWTLARALTAVHREGVVHRDLKPTNILVNVRGEPVVIDFGLALDVTRRGAREEGREICGTVAYMSPEQARGENDRVGPRSDLFSLGVVLYELLAGVRPFHASSTAMILQAIGDRRRSAVPPSHHRSEIEPELDAIVLKALEKSLAARFADMDEFAGALADYLRQEPERPTGATEGLRPKQRWFGLLGKGIRTEPHAAGDGLRMENEGRPGSGRVARDRVRFTFVGHGEVAPPLIDGQDRLYLDVGEGLRAAVIDHHQGGDSLGSAASNVLAHPEFVRQALKAWRSDDDPFSIVLHRDPDLDAIASTYLALSILCEGRPPEGASALAGYVDAIDRGEPGMSLERPFSPYSALMQIAHRQSLMKWESDDDCWRALVESGLKVLGFALAESTKTGKPLAEIDAFDCPGLFRNLDRTEVKSDIDRYAAKLADPKTHARIASLRLPRKDGGTGEVDALLVRHVQDAGDPERCLFFKEWARTDRSRSRRGHGFTALAVIGPGRDEGTTRGIISVRPDSGVVLDGLAALLEAAETARRIARFGTDDRLAEPDTGKPLTPRPGYKNSDPWYDGRAHESTIVDAPRGGSWLRAEQIETVFLRFGGFERSRPKSS